MEEQHVYSDSEVVETTLTQPTTQDESTAALVYSIVGMALCESGLLGLIFSLIARKKVKSSLAAGAMNGKLRTAKILSMLGVIFSIIMIAFWLLYSALACAAIGGSVYYQQIH